MKACTHCGFDFEHNPETCRVLIREKQDPGLPKPSIMFAKARQESRKIFKPTLNASPETLVELVDFINKRRIK